MLDAGVPLEDVPPNDEDHAPLLAVGEWTVAPYPRAERVGDLDGYWQEILGRVPLTTNEPSVEAGG
jgi:hypothetical protein